MIKQVLEQKLKLAIEEARSASEDPAASYEAGAASSVGQCDGWVEALEWMLSACDRTYTPSAIEVVQIKYTEPTSGEGRSYTSKQMMRWEAEAELVHEAELSAEGYERWPGVIEQISTVSP